MPVLTVSSLFSFTLEMSLRSLSFWRVLSQCWSKQQTPLKCSYLPTQNPHVLVKFWLWFSHLHDPLETTLKLYFFIFSLSFLAIRGDLNRQIIERHVGKLKMWKRNLKNGFLIWWECRLDIERKIKQSIDSQIEKRALWDTNVKLDCVRNYGNCQTGRNNKDCRK